MKVAVTGATGFIGSYLIQDILQNTDWDVVAMSRREWVSENPRLECRKGDLYSLLDCEKLLKDCDVAIYLVHSMSPSSRLSQGSFQDFDFILADNFAKAAEKNNLKHIIYVSGLIPNTKHLSKHLESRLEVEQTLSSHQVPCTTLRCGIVIGDGGSSFSIVEKLVERLPVIALPSWTFSKTQAIFINDLVWAIQKMVEEEEPASKAYDLGTEEMIEYNSLLKKTSQAKSKKNIFIKLPIIPIFLSKLWVRLITGQSKDLVYPLIESLVHNMLVLPQNKFPWGKEHQLTSVDNAIDKSISTKAQIRLPMRKVDKKEVVASVVQSVQRLPYPKSWTMTELAQYYLIWLPRFLWPFLKVKTENEKMAIYFRLMTKPLLELSLSKERTFKGRELFYITGGVLSKTHSKSRLEFRLSPNDDFFIAAIHSYRPRLPWYIYRYSQAVVHKMVMYCFGKELGKISDKKPAQ